MTPSSPHSTVEGAVLNTYPVCDASLLPAVSHPHSSRGIQSSICVQLIETATQICKSAILMSQSTVPDNLFWKSLESPGRIPKQVERPLLTPQEQRHLFSLSAARTE